MKKYLLILIAACACSWQTMAQQPDPKDGSRLEALKIAFLTKKLNLSTEEAQRFWPIYNQYAQEIKKIRQEQIGKGVPELDAEDRILNIRKRYNGEFSKALSNEKANAFFRSEKEFGGFIQRELQDRRMNQLNRRPFKQ
jgi:hypothetical protein